ncbi:MAG: hypothetical protein C0408_03175 [Odoribacter sp.]|nr:hypothetical protein [Odoribacter sp.]
MENSEKKMTPEESLNLIGEVISNTRNNLRTDSFFFLLWGWFITVAAIVEAVILWNAGRMNDWKNVSLLSGLNWGGIVLIGLIIQVFYIKKHYVKKGHRTFFEKVISYIWIFSGVIIFLMIYLSGTRHESPEPYILAVVSIPTVVTGLMTRFRPLIIGGLLFILFAVLAVNVQTDWLRSLVTAAALIFGYLIPGYLLRKKIQ